MNNLGGIYTLELDRCNNISDVSSLSKIDSVYFLCYMDKHTYIYNYKQKYQISFNKYKYTHIYIYI